MTRGLLLLFLTCFLVAQSAHEVEISAEPHHHAGFANRQVRILNVEVPPHAETLMHWHRHDYIYVVLGAAQIVNAVEGKDPVTLTLPDGDVRFVSAPFAHIFRNLSAQPFRNVTVELLQDDKGRRSSPHWDPAHPEEDRGLDILHGGTSEILFVKDGVRVSEFELQPKAAIPARSASLPILLVAVTDLDLSTNDHRAHDMHTPAPAPSHFNAGDSKWLPFGFGRPLVNAGSHNAKFVTLEFH